MNYNNWIIPIFLMLLLGGLFFGYHLQKLFSLHNKRRKILFWVLNYLLVVYIVLARNILSAFLLHAIVLFLLYDFVLWIIQKTKRQKMLVTWKKLYFYGIPIFAISFLITLYGFYNAFHPEIHDYSIQVSKTMKEDVTIGMISDLHLGTVYSEAFFDHLISSANQIDADIFVLDGDIFDEFTSESLKDMALKRFQEIETKYGVYYIEGNHDLMDKKQRKKIEKTSIKTLEDEVKVINDNICLIGRKDYRRVRLGEGRKDLKDLVKECPKDLPRVVVDHQPEDDQLGEKLGVDLQLSGHTHAGQFFPANFFIKNGLYETGDYHLIVSSGYGAWNIPIRTASHSEMVKVVLSGKKN